MARKVTTIPAIANLNTAAKAFKLEKRKVAGYARVSTDHEDQITSYEAQKDYYESYIKSRDDWEFVEVYTDEGISATSTKRREGFKRMIKDALDGKIDLIVTKSVSRFARNTVDSLSTIRKLKEHGTEVYFEKENIWTFDSKGELLITIMSSLAQEESRSISENCTWGQRKRFADGKVTVPFGQFLGYDRGPNGELIVNKEEAEVVKRIYRLFLEGKTAHTIAKILTDDGTLSPAKKNKWSAGTVKGILKNEKYKGDALLQKTFTVNFLTKEKKKNEGEIPQYYVTQNHEAIIEPSIFDKVQRELELRGGTYKSRKHIYSSKIICGKCGNYYGSKTWHSTSKYKRVVWQCNGKYSCGCNMPTFNEEEIQEAFVNEFNKLIEVKDDFIKTNMAIVSKVFSTEKLEKDKNKLEKILHEIADKINLGIIENARKLQDQDEYNKEYAMMVAEFNKLKERLEKIESEITKKQNKKDRIESFIKALKDIDILAEFNKDLWCVAVEEAVVEKDGSIRFKWNA